MSHKLTPDFHFNRMNLLSQEHVDAPLCSDSGWAVGWLFCFTLSQLQREFFNGIKIGGGDTMHAGKRSTKSGNYCNRSKLLSYAALTAAPPPPLVWELKANFPRRFDICMQPLFNHSVGGSHLSIQSLFQRAQTHAQVGPPWAGKTNKEEEHVNINLWE